MDSVRHFLTDKMQSYNKLELFYTLVYKIMTMTTAIGPQACLAAVLGPLACLAAVLGPLACLAASTRPPNLPNKNNGTKWGGLNKKI